jgi:hypothetical protein
MLSKLKQLWSGDERVQFAAYLILYFAIISLVPQVMRRGGEFKWVIWPLVLLAQNFAFTFVSRARSSASIMRHAKASLMSNGIWIVSQVILLGPMFDYLNGTHGLSKQMLAEVVYTISTMSGSLYAHYHALKTEKGKNAVGASKLYAQIPVAEYENFKAVVANYVKEHTFKETVGVETRTSVSIPGYKA